MSNLHYDANIQPQRINFGSSRAYQDSLVSSHLSLVQKMAKIFLKKFTETCLEYDDLVSAGDEALVKASREYNPDRGVPFEAFAWCFIKNSFTKAYWELQPVKLNSKNCHSVKFMCIDEIQGDGLESLLCMLDSYDIEREELVCAVTNVVSRLNYKERLLFKLRFEDGLTLKELGGIFHVSHQAVAKQVDRMLLKLKEMLVREVYGYKCCA